MYHGQTELQHINVKILQSAVCILSPVCGLQFVFLQIYISNLHLYNPVWCLYIYVIQVDVLEDPIFKNVILLQTVLQEVRTMQLTI